ncbi:UNVERIFIED_CONTAM: VQ motif-containing protein 4 [Sesamum latifolium]|uniref:VQ motif-containing protein 4 n=1 Tax=Sesamum latifolium TaxID=2727402 RepID=A0AAW2TPD9_9LAMI
MEMSTSPEKDNPSPTTSPHSNASSTTTGPPLNLIPTPPLTPTAAVPSPKPISRSHEPSPYPTTFVQADTSTFKQVVQMLTGSSDTAKQASKTDPAPRGGGSRIPPIKSTEQKKQGFKLYERRNSLKNGLMINTLIPGFSHTSGFSPRNPEILSPSILDFPSLVLSPVTPLNDDSLKALDGAVSVAFNGGGKSDCGEEVLLPSVAEGGAEPQLLPLFPTTSPRVSGSSS